MSTDSKFCCVNGCNSKPSDRDEKGVPTKFFTFPTFRLKHYLPKREAWIKAVAKHNNDPQWQPIQNQKICNKHFVHGRKHDHPLHPSYKPVIFPGKKVKLVKSFTSPTVADRGKKPKIKIVLKKKQTSSPTKERDEDSDNKSSKQSPDKAKSEVTTKSSVTDKSNSEEVIDTTDDKESSDDLKTQSPKKSDSKNTSTDKKVTIKIQKKVSKHDPSAELKKYLQLKKDFPEKFAIPTEFKQVIVRKKPLPKKIIKKSTTVVSTPVVSPVKKQVSQQLKTAKTVKCTPIIKEISSQAKKVTIIKSGSPNKQVSEQSKTTSAAKPVPQTVDSTDVTDQEKSNTDANKPKELDAITIAKPVLSVINNAKQSANQKILNTSVKRIVGVKIENNKRIILVKNICKIITPDKLHFGCQVNSADDKEPIINSMVCNRIITPDKCHAEVQTTLKKIEVRNKGTMAKVSQTDRGSNTLPDDYITHLKDNRTFEGYSSLKPEDDMSDICSIPRSLFVTLKEMIPPTKVKAKIIAEDKLLMTLMKIKHGLGFSSLTVLFQTHKTTLGRSFLEIINSLAESLKKEIYWPTRDVVKESMPAIYKAKYPNCRGIVRFFEMAIEAPRKPEHRKLFYLNTNCSHFYKFFIVFAPNGFVSFRSKCYSERFTNKHMLRDSQFLDLIEEDDTLLVDEKFPVEIKTELQCKNCKCVLIQKYVPRTDEEVEAENCKVDLYYDHIKRCVDRIKQYRILELVRSELYSNIDDILLVICGLINMQRPLVQIIRGKYNRKPKSNEKERTTEEGDMNVDNENSEANEGQTTTGTNTGNTENETTEKDKGNTVEEDEAPKRKRRRKNKQPVAENKKRPSTEEIDTDFLTELGLDTPMIPNTKDKQINLHAPSTSSNPQEVWRNQAVLSASNVYTEENWRNQCGVVANPGVTEQQWRDQLASITGTSYPQIAQDNWKNQTVVAVQSIAGTNYTEQHWRSNYYKHSGKNIYQTNSGTNTNYTQANWRNNFY